MHWTGSQSSFLTLLILKIKFSNLPTLYRFCLVQTSHNFQQATAVSRAILQFCQLRADPSSRCLHVPLHAGTYLPNSSWAICLTLDYVLRPAVWLGGIKSCTTGNRKKNTKAGISTLPSKCCPSSSACSCFPMVLQLCGNKHWTQQARQKHSGATRPSCHICGIREIYCPCTGCYSDVFKQRTRTTNTEDW